MTTTKIEETVNYFKKHYHFLFERGFNVSRTEYHENHFGNWLVVLHSAKCSIRFIQDRGEISLSVGPSWASPSWTGGPWFGIEAVVIYLTKDEKVIDSFNSAPSKLTEQLERLNKLLLQYIDRILEIFNDDSFPQIQDDLDRYMNWVSSHYL